MPTIRIDAETFEGLKKLAEPFVDSPNAVIKRLLIDKGVLSERQSTRRPQAVVVETEKRALTPELTPQAVYEQFLLAILAQELAGRGDKRTVTRAVIEKMVKHGFLGPPDLELVATGETRAENTITWGRNALKNRGYIARGSKRGEWELTEEGREAAAVLELPKKPR